MQRNVNIRNSDFRENPLGTAEGQEVVSISETFWHRLAREGRPRNAIFQGSAITVGTFKSSVLIKPSLGCIFYPQKIIASATVDACLYIAVITGIQDAEEQVHALWCPAGQKIEFEPNGSLGCVYNSNASLCGRVELRASTTNTSLHSTTQTGTTVSGSRVITALSYATNLMKGMTIAGTGIPANTKIVDIISSSSSILISANATATNTEVTLTLTDTAAGLWGSVTGIEVVQNG